MRALLALILLLNVSVQAAVDPYGQFAAKTAINDYGIYELLEKTQRQFSANTTAGYNSVIKTRLLEKTTQIPLRKGVVFGFNYQITDHAVNKQWVPVVLEYKHPELRDFLGRPRSMFLRNSAARLQSDGRFGNGAYYIFSEPEEMVSGEWQIRVIYNGDVVAAKHFSIQ